MPYLMTTEEIADLKNAREEATRLRKENVILTRRLSEASVSAEPSASGVGGASPDSCPKLKVASKLRKKLAAGGDDKDKAGSFGGSVLTVSSSEDGFETVTMSPDVTGRHHVIPAVGHVIIM